MKEYRVIVSEGTKKRFRQCLLYLRGNVKSEQAVKAVYDDYVQTRKSLQEIAGSIRLCDDPDLASLGVSQNKFQET